MRAMEIDDEGLDSTDRKLLAAIVQKFASGPVGVAALAAVLSEEIETIEDVYEPFLLRLGFIDRTPQGRIATDLARAHLSGLGYEIPPPRRLGPRRCPACGTCRRSATRRRSRTSRTPRPRTRDGPIPGHARRATRSTSRRRRTARRGHGPGRLTLTHGVVETPQFMPVGTNATVKALTPGRHPRDRRLDHPRQHLPPVPAARPRADRPARRPASVHGLGRPDPDRLGRLPGRLARRPAGRRRGRGHVPEPSRRLAPPVHAGARDRRPGGARLGHRGRLRPAGLPELAARRGRGGDRADPPLGGAVARRAHPRRTRPSSGSSRAASNRTCGPRRPSSSRACRSTASASAAWPATRRPPSATRRSTSRSRCSPTTRGRAT